MRARPPLYEPIPPRLYGGIERVVAVLTDALVELSHDMPLFASADAVTKARLVPLRDLAIRLDATSLKSDVAAHLAMLHDVRTRPEDRPTFMVECVECLCFLLKRRR